MSETVNTILCKNCGGFILAGDFSRKQSLTEKREMGSLISDGHEAKNMALSEWKSADLDYCNGKCSPTKTEAGK